MPRKGKEANLLRASLQASGRAAGFAAARLRRVGRWLWASRRVRRATAAFACLALVLLVAYVTLSLRIARELVQIERRPLVTSPAQVGLSYQDVQFHTQDGMLLRGWLIDARRHQGERRLVILFQDVRGSRGDPTTLALMAGLADAGFAVLAFDQRGTGASDGQLYTLGYDERYDLLGALEFVQSQGYTAGSVGVLGLGTGGAVALLTAAESTDFAALISDSSYASLPDRIRSLLRQRHLPTALLWGIRQTIRSRYGPDVSHILPEAAVARMASRPLLVIHGQRDQKVPVDHARRLVEAAGPDAAELWVVSGAGHLEALTQHQEDYLRRLVAFFERTLGKYHE